LRGGSPDPPRGIFGLNRDLANATFILTHGVCLAAIAVAGLVWRIGGLENSFANLGWTN